VLQENRQAFTGGHDALFFACQGAGYIPYPKSSFMVDNSRWITYGLAIAFFGMVVVFVGRRQ
jgi:hypothetical protein